MNIRTLGPIDEHLLPECLELLERTQGRNVCNLAYLKKLISTENGLLLVVQDDEQHIVAVAGAQILDNTNFQYYLPFGEEIVHTLNSSKVGSFCTMSVHEKLQGQGYGQKLSALRLEWLKTNACDVVVGITWVSGLGHHSGRVFEKLGFRAVNKVENFFVESSIRDNLLCPVCVVAPCYCPGIMYFRTLS